MSAQLAGMHREHFLIPFYTLPHDPYRIQERDEFEAYDKVTMSSCLHVV